MSVFNINLSTKTLFGVDSHKQLGKKLAEFGATKTILVYDIAMGQLGYADELLQLIEAEGIGAVGYQVEEGEPDSDKIDRLYAFASDKDVDAIVGFGGGTSMDTAKFLGLMLANGGKAADYLGYTNKAGSKKFGTIITMPTTSGTGAEVSPGLVCANAEKGTKAATVSSVTFSIVDPAYTVGLPPAVTAGTGMDAFAHVIESICNGSGMKNWMADLTAGECLRICYKYLPIAVADGKNMEAREKMSFAALLGGYTLANRKTTFGHLFANEVSDTWHLSHNIGAALAASATVRYIAAANPDAMKVVAEALNLPYETEEEKKAAGEELIRRTDELQKKVGMPTMKELDFTKEFLDEAIEHMKLSDKWKIIPPVDWDAVKMSLYESFDI